MNYISQMLLYDVHATASIDQKLSANLMLNNSLLAMTVEIARIATPINLLIQALRRTVLARQPQNGVAMFSPPKSPSEKPAQIRLSSSLCNNIAGASAVEFALVLPIFLFFVLGVISYGIYLGAAHCVEQLAADSARASVAGLSSAERQALAVSQVTNHVVDYPLLRANRISTSAGAASNDPNQFKVVISYDASDLPIWAFTGLLPLPSRTIVRTASIKNGGY